MQIAARTISAVGHIITGDSIPKLNKAIAPYRSGPQLVSFFNDFGGNDTYAAGFPSRWKYAEEKLQQHNGTVAIAKIVSEALCPARFVNTEYSADECAEYVNQHLRYDGFEAKKAGDRFALRDLKGEVLRVDNPFTEEKLSHQFIAEQIEKADTKIATGDYSGAITNARSLLEAVLIELESHLSADAPEPDGDLLKLYKRVQKLLHLEPSGTDILESLKAVLSGLSSIVAGLAPMRNRMSDAHASNYRPAKRHAKLAVNAAKTLTDFLYESFDHQTTAAQVKSKKT